MGLILDTSVLIDAERAGLVYGGLKSQGIALELADLLIGVIALHFGHGVAMES